MGIEVFAFGGKDGEIGKWTDEAEMIAEGLTKLSGRGPIQVKSKGGERYRKPQKPKDGLQSALSILKHDKDEKHTVFIRDAKSKLWVAKKGELHYDAPPAPGNVSKAIRECHDYVFTRAFELEQKFGREVRVVTMGYTVNKWINGQYGGTPSQHCDGPPAPDGGNAMDWVLRSASGRNDIMLTDILVNELEQRRFAAQVLWRGVANHFPWHVHVSGRPLRVGTPAALR